MTNEQLNELERLHELAFNAGVRLASYQLERDRAQADFTNYLNSLATPEPAKRGRPRKSAEPKPQGALPLA